MPKPPKKKAKAKPNAAPDPFYRPFSSLASGTSTKKAPSGIHVDPPEAPRRAVSAEAAKPDRTLRGIARAPAAEGAEGLDDDQRFAIYMSGVRALDERAVRVPRTGPTPRRAGSTAAHDASAPPEEEARAELGALVGAERRFETTDDGARIEGRRLDVDPRELRRLRHGKYAIDGKLDLHGLGVVDARQAVEKFVKKRSEDGDLSIVIVHGKGQHSPRGQGVLRGEIAAWLSQGRSARHVAAFATAPEDLGGEGALLVLLAR